VVNVPKAAVRPGHAGKELGFEMGHQLRDGAANKFHRSLAFPAWSVIRNCFGNPPPKIFD
jgi:hypothetical protein